MQWIYLLVVVTKTKLLKLELPGIIPGNRYAKGHRMSFCATARLRNRSALAKLAFLSVSNAAHQSKMKMRFSSIVCNCCHGI